MTIIATLLLSALSPGAAQATPPSAAPVAEAVDPARLAAATELLDLLMPPAMRDQMIDGIMTPMLANMRRGMSEDPSFAAEINGDPRFKKLFDDMMTQQEKRITGLLREAMPGMIPAMARAYARRFTVQQLKESQTFFETPTGRAYMQFSTTVMADPDVAAWQRQMMQQAMTALQEDVAKFVSEAEKLAKKP